MANDSPTYDFSKLIPLIEQESGHVRACAYTAAASDEQRLKHYLSHEPPCDGFVRASEPEAELPEPAPPASSTRTHETVTVDQVVQSNPEPSAGKDYLPFPVTAVSIVELLNAAYLDAELDQAGDAVYKGRLRIFLLPANGEVRLLVRVHAAPGRTRSQHLEFANRINVSLKVPRATFLVGDDGSESYIFDWYVPATEPLPNKTLIHAVQRFEASFPEIGKLDRDDLIL